MGLITPPTPHDRLLSRSSHGSYINFRDHKEIIASSYQFCGLYGAYMKLHNYLMMKRHPF